MRIDIRDDDLVVKHFAEICVPDVGDVAVTKNLRQVVLLLDREFRLAGNPFAQVCDRRTCQNIIVARRLNGFQFRHVLTL